MQRRSSNRRSSAAIMLPGRCRTSMRTVCASEAGLARPLRDRFTPRSVRSGAAPKRRHADCSTWVTMSPIERLSALHAAFLGLESETVPFVIGSVLRFDRRIELARLRAWVDAALDGLPRYRQRRDHLPVLRHPIWIDDDRFDVARHVLPSPAGTSDPQTLAA